MASSKWKPNIASWLCCCHNQPDQVPNAPPGGPDPDQIPNAPPCVPDLPVFKTEITPEVLDEFLDCIEKQLKCLTSAGSSSISRLASQWGEYTGYATSCMQKLPSNLTQEVAQTSESLLLPLLSQALGGLGNLHWVAVGFSFIAWSLDMIATNTQNYKDCLDLLERTVSVLKTTRKLWQVTSDNDDIVESLQNLVESALQCAIICGSMIDDSLPLRILKASIIKDSIANVHIGLDRAVQQISYVIQVDTRVEGKRALQRQVTYTRNDQIVGGDEVMREAMDRLTKDGSEIVAVCLHGMGGIGKSTIGMNIFAELQGMKSDPQGTTRLYRCCRVELRMGIEEGELPGIQKQILGKICRLDRTPEFSNALDGRKELERELKKLTEPVFLYLDNVLEKTHLSELLPRAELFPKGSRVLVTTRNEDVCGGLVELGMSDCKPYVRVKKMDEQAAKELLRRHAGGPPIDEETEKLVLNLCDGLPLALKLVGSYINVQGPGDAKVVWNRVIDAMKAAEPLNGTKKDPLYSSLRFSIDDLDLNVKKAFLDIVAFAAEGWSWSDAAHLVNPRHLENLRQRALVEKISSRMALHDVLKMMGLQMVKADTEEIRIRCEDDLCEISALEKVVGLRSVRVQAQQLQQMPRLRFLGHVTIKDGECQATPAKLKNLSVVRGLRSESSRPFDMSACKALKALSWWECLGNARDLEVLGCERLETLTIRGWNSLLSVDAVTRLQSLKILGISECRRLQSLPEGVASLTGLEELDLSWCTRLPSLPEGIAGLTNLKRLKLWRCGRVQSVPEGVASLTGLEELDLSLCERLQSLPEGIAGLTNLKRLKLWCCESVQSLPEGVASLTGLEELDLSGCKRLQSLPEGIAGLTNLKRLKLGGCESVQSVPEGVASLTGLEELDLSWCERLQSLPEGIASLTNLTNLCLDGCQSFQSLPISITSLTGLEVLNLMGCCGIQALPDGMFGQLTGLKTLGLDACWCPRRTLVRPLKPASSAPNSRSRSAILLGEAHMWNSSNVGGQLPLYLTHLFSLPEEISQLTTLQSLGLQFCCEVEALPSALTDLRLEYLQLRFRGCSRLPEDIVQLNSLSLELVLNDGDFEALPSALSRLQDLTIWLI